MHRFYKNFKFFHSSQFSKINYTLHFFLYVNTFIQKFLSFVVKENNTTIPAKFIIAFLLFHFIDKIFLTLFPLPFYS